MGRQWSYKARVLKEYPLAVCSRRTTWDFLESTDRVFFVLRLNGPEGIVSAQGDTPQQCWKQTFTSYVQSRT